MPKRLARKPSTASLIPATRNRMKANSISPDPIAQTMTGTSRIRAIVMRFGRFKPDPRPADDVQIDPPRAACQAIAPGPIPPYHAGGGARVCRKELRTSEIGPRSEEHTSELQSRGHLVCRLLLEKK